MESNRLQDLARRTLQQPPGAVPPNWYLTALQRHAVFSKDDLNFVVRLTPNTGYGLVTCFEPGCRGAIITLGPRVHISNQPYDDGKKDGFGSFGAYQQHCKSDGHQEARDARLQSNTLATPATPAVKPRGSNSSILASLNGATSSPSNYHLGSSPRAAPATVSSSAVPRKRASQSFEALLGLDENEDAKPPVAAAAQPPPAKKTRTALSATAAQTNNKTNSAATPADLSAVPPPTGSTFNDPTTAMQVYGPKPVAASHLAPAPAPAFEPQIITPTIVAEEERTRTYTLHLQIEQSKIAIMMKRKLNKTTERKIDRANAMIQTYELAINASRKKIADERATIQKRQEAARNAQAAVVPKVQLQTETPGASGSGWGGKISASPRLPTLPPPRYFDGEDVLGNMLDTFSQASYGASSSYNTDILNRTHTREDIDDYIKSMAGDAFDENVTVDEAAKKLGLQHNMDLLSGLACRLLPHQVMGVAWMVEREKHRDRGGILADEMGLGNIQTIATMTQNLSDNPTCKTTLIVAPVALLNQWKAEIEAHTDPDMFKVAIFHGTSRPTNLRKYDVVLTTYGTIGAQCPKFTNETTKKKKKLDDFIESDDEDNSDEGGYSKKSKKRVRGPLITTKWFRVVLDEAQVVRNKATHVSDAVGELDATYRWCLTGTPITNGLSDAYGLFRFLRLRPWYDWTNYREEVLSYEKKDPQTACQKLQAILNVCMMRRLKTSKLDGQPLIVLPEKHMEDVVMSFQPEEQEVYDFVQARAQAKFNKFLRQGVVLKHYHEILVMLLRLRQICVHPCLITETLDAFRTQDELDNPEKGRKNEVLARAKALLGVKWVDKVVAKLQEEADELAAAELTENGEVDVASCPVCYEPLDEAALVSACIHFICKDCFDKIQEAPFEPDPNETVKYKRGERPCPSCRAPISNEHSFIRSAFEPDSADINDVFSGAELTAHLNKLKKDGGDVVMSENAKSEKTESRSASPELVAAGKRSTRPQKKRRITILESDSEDSIYDFIVPDSTENDEDYRSKKKEKGKGKGKAKISDEDFDASEAEESEDDEDFLKHLPIADAKKLNAPPPEVLSSFLPSTKMKAMMEELKRVRKEFPKEKVIVVSQWTSALDLVSAYLLENGFDHVQYRGNMSKRHRDDAITTFMDPSASEKVMLMSLKAGGVGLTLTTANRVISLDLAWSTAGDENQAFDRVHRLGQHRQCYIKRLVIDKTVEARVLELQIRKQSLADGSLGEGTGRKFKFTVAQLAGMFGLNKYGEALAADAPLPN